MNDCNQCELYNVDPLNHVVTCEYYKHGHCNSDTAGTEHERYYVEVWLRDTETDEVIDHQYKWGQVVHMPTQRVEVWVNDHLVWDSDSNPYF